MKKMKKFAALALAGVLTCTALTGCGQSANSGEQSNSAGTGEKLTKIGICQLVAHKALDASYNGFIAALKDAGYEDGKNIQLDLQNAQGDQSNCNTIASKFANDNMDLILAIATPAAQSCFNATKDIPILVTAVTDPADAGLVNSNEAPGTNVSGTSDLNPIKEQMELLTQLIPDAKHIAILYCSAESNSELQANMAEAVATEMGITSERATVSNSNEIQQVVQSLVGKVDAIYAPTDNMIANGMATVSMVATPNGIPVICGEENMVNEGGLATYGINYYELGYQTGVQAVKIIKGEAKPADMPIEYCQNLSLTINKDIAAQLGITIPDELLAKLGE